MKVKVTLTCDHDVLQKAKENEINISFELNNLLKNLVNPKKTRLAEDCLMVRCSQCKKPIEDGYRCVHTGKAFCEECQKVYKMEWCFCESPEHLHEKW